MNQLILPSSQNFEERKTVYTEGRPVSHSFPQFDIPFLLIFAATALGVVFSPGKCNNFKGNEEIEWNSM